MLWMNIATALSWALFFKLWKSKKASLLNGALLFHAVAWSLILMGFIGFEYNIYSVRLLFVIIFFAILLIITSSLFIFFILATYSAIMLLKKERMSIANLLSLGAAIGILIYFFMQEIIFSNDILILIAAIFAYMACMYAIFISTSLLFLLHFKIESLDYIIVLGCKLINGDGISKLLASRIEKAIELYQKFPNSILIMSGGKGTNEIVSEAHAMKQYAIEKGVPFDKIIVEECSTTTNENLVLSNQLIQKPANIAFVSNYYHVYRAGIIAQKEKIEAIGIGSPAKFYYAFNALIREFIAVMIIYKKFNGCMLLILLLGLIVLKVLSIL